MKPYPFGTAARFADRRDAGRRLAVALKQYKHEDAAVLALPRGGVPVAYEIARALEAPLEPVLVRKIGAPDHPELGIGAVVDGAHPQLVLNDDLIRRLEVAPEWIRAAMQRELAEIERRRQRYCGERPPPDIESRLVIVVDDGIATGSTVRAALKGLMRSKPRELVLAVPVAPRETVEALHGEADEVVCLATPDPFYAVGNHYEDFRQTGDEEVIRLLEARLAEHAEAQESGE